MAGADRPGAGGGHQGHALQHPGLSERTRQRHCLLHRYGQVARRRPVDEGGFQRRRFRQGGPGSGRDRSAAVSGSTRSGSSYSGARPGSAGQREAGSGALPELLKTDAIPKQQLDTQTALVAQYEGTIKQDHGQHRQRQAAADLCQGHGADHGRRGPAPGGSRKHRPRLRRERHGRDHPAAADRRAVYHSRGQPSAGHAKAARRRASAGGCVQPRQFQEAGVRDAGDRWTTRSTTPRAPRS